MRSSMSRKGNCWDNAPTESFWGRLKTASVHGQKFATREQARQAVMDWMPAKGGGNALTSMNAGLPDGTVSNRSEPAALRWRW